MKSPNIGRGIAFVLIFGLVAWTAFRALGARLPETPKIPFPAPAIDAPLATAKSQQTAVFAGGCFWGVQAVFEHLRGVSTATSGYAGGYVKSPSYESVSMGVTGHAETVSVVYDSSKLTYGQLLMVFFSVAHDPTQWNRQGPDTGSQYRGPDGSDLNCQRRLRFFKTHLRPALDGFFLRRPRSHAMEPSGPRYRLPVPGP